jgi:hypothetical protein
LPAPVTSPAGAYRLGNRSALEWVVDQYQVTEDKRSGSRSDPNRADAAGYIVTLAEQVVRVGIATVRMINGPPAEFAAPGQPPGRSEDELQPRLEGVQG